MRSEERGWRVLTMAVVLAVCAVAAQDAAGRTLDATVAAEVDALLDRLEEDGDFAAAEAAALEVFDGVIAYGPAERPEAFRHAAGAVRLVRQLRAAPEGRRGNLLGYLRENPGLRRTLTFLIRPEDELGGVLGVLDDLRAEHGDVLERYANLAAAICVVHDRPLQHRINENLTDAPEPVKVFDYFRSNERRMAHGLRHMPAELLVYVVDTAVSIEEMEWALSRYAGHPRVGELFFSIDYDYDAYYSGAEKRVTAEGWNLPNILEYGGVCADQAYFAVAVGKSIGVPTAYTSGQSGSSRHAWVGFLDVRGRRATWDFGVGRYDAYQGVRGELTDPQTREHIPDGYLALMAESVGTSLANRHTAAAMTDAARRLLELADEGDGEFAPEPLRGGRRTKREAGVEAVTELIEAALRANAGYLPAWLTIGELAESGRLGEGQTRRWAMRVERLCGQAYPDFALAILKPMIEGVKDVERQNQLWERAFGMFSGRADLAAEVRMAQGRMWREADELERAGRCYEDVLVRFANAGPFVIEALEQTERMLVELEREERVVLLYDQVWSRLREPRSDTVRDQSNWYRVGRMYTDKLRASGYGSQADQVQAALRRD